MASWQLFALFGLLYAICWWISKAVQARVNRFIEPAERSGQAAEETEAPEPRPKAKRTTTALLLAALDAPRNAVVLHRVASAIGKPI